MDKNYGYLHSDSLAWIINFIHEKKIKTIFEIGTCHGFSAIEFAKHCERVVTVEISKERYELTKKKLESINNIQIILGDARGLEIKEKFDLVFIDGTSREYLDYFKKALKITNKYIIADNTDSHKGRMLNFIEETKRYNSKFLHIGKGLVIITV